jgi:hypothetical protein
VGDGPKHRDDVKRVLERFDAVTLDEIAERLHATPRPNKADLPSEALVRLTRRARVAKHPHLERLAVKILFDRVMLWTSYAYRTLPQSDRDDLSAAVLMAVAKALKATSAIDYWEDSFQLQCYRAAADAYQSYFARHRAREASLELTGDVFNDGSDAGNALQRALAIPVARKLLEPRDMPYFEAMFIWGLPILSAKASMDLVRLFDKPEGTLREIKTRITNALRSAGDDHDDA